MEKWIPTVALLFTAKNMVVVRFFSNLSSCADTQNKFEVWKMVHAMGDKAILVGSDPQNKDPWTVVQLKEGYLRFRA